MSEEVPGSNRWWEADKSELNRTVIAAVNQIQDATKGLQQRLLRCMKAYGGRGFMSGGRFPAQSGLGGTLGQGQRQGPRDNIIYTSIRAARAQIYDVGPPGVTFMTNHGNWDQQCRAELLERFTDGLAYQSNLNEQSVIALDDCMIGGTGYIKHWVDADNTIWSSRTFPAEIMVDPWDGRDKKPRSMHQVGFIDRDVLAARYPSKEKIIDQANTHLLSEYYTSSEHSSNNLVPFIESWHLPRRRDAKDGRHTLVLGTDDTILDERYEEMDFPFSVIRWENLPTGFHGMGIAEMMAGAQLSLNNCNTAEYWAWSQVASPRLFARSGTINVDHLNSSLSGIILQGKEEPKVLNWSATHPEFVAYKKDLKVNAFSQQGISPMMAAGIKPDGLDSAVAQREFKATLRSIFSVQLARWQELRVDCSRKQIALARHVYTTDKKFSVRCIGAKFVETIPWKDASLEDDEYVMQPKVISQLPKDPAGQMQTAEELAQSSYADTWAARKLITTIPDLGADADLENAAYDNAQRTAYLMLVKGEPQTPMGFQNIQVCVKVITEQMLQATDQGCPSERIKMCQRWLDIAAQPPFTPAAPAGMPAPGSAAAPAPPAGPIAQGAPPPTSTVLPFKQPRQ